MRDILFQGKEVKKDDPYDFSDWIVGLPLYGPNDEDKINFIYNPYFGAREVIPESVGEYTGVRDSRSVRIFEHDIVKPTPNSDLRFIVEYDEHNCCFVLASVENKSIKFPLSSQLAKECIIVGNLFDEEENK